MDEAGRRRREFIRVHHPDRGGDPDVFVAGLRSFDSGAESSGREPLPRVVVVRRRAWLVRMAIARPSGCAWQAELPRVR